MFKKINNKQVLERLLELCDYDAKDDLYYSKKRD